MAEQKIGNKTLKKDPNVVRDTRDEINEDMAERPTSPHLEDHNRDRARGDWDRSGDHHDV